MFGPPQGRYDNRTVSQRDRAVGGKVRSNTHNIFSILDKWDTTGFRGLDELFRPVCHLHLGGTVSEAQTDTNLLNLF